MVPTTQCVSDRKRLKKAFQSTVLTTRADIPKPNGEVMTRYVHGESNIYFVSYSYGWGNVIIICKAFQHNKDWYAEI